MRLKDGVITTGIRPEIVVALVAADGVYARNGLELVVTSITDGKHSLTSLHYAGSAADLRTNNIPAQKRELIAQQIRDALGSSPDYDVVLEDTHIHVEYQPKYRGDS